jgi:iron complex outermembrane receptor protein
LQRLKQLSLEDLMNQEVTTVSRTPERLFDTASAIQVVRGEDIQRSGALTLGDALRLAPNLQVAQQNAHDWAITARGFNGAPLANNSLADKLLVMIDGRSIYTPLFGGVFWDVQQVLLQDIDRIEVVSGPGATLWGANAVNGVINIVTKSARDTQGLTVTGGAGSFLRDFGAVQYGGGSSNIFYRVYGQRFDHDSSHLPNGDSAIDDWDLTQGGFRMDYYPTEENTLTFQGDFYSGAEGTPEDVRVDGQNVLGKWERKFSEESELIVNAYYDRTWRHTLSADFTDQINTFDLDVQHRLPLGERQVLLWGGEYRLMSGEVNNTPALSFSPARSDMQLFSGFVQDEIQLVPERLTLTLGTKLEHNDFSGFEAQPSARISWTLTSRQTLWAAISRSVRSPARFDADEITPFLTTPNGDFKSEKVLAYEIGYRIRPIDEVTLSLAGFYNDYDDLRSLNIGPNQPTLLVFANDQSGQSWGLEFSGSYQATEWWRFRGGYSFFGKDLDAENAFVFPGSATFEGDDPESQALLQSIMNLPENFQFDMVGRYVTSLPETFLPTPKVPAYFTFDARLAWHYKRIELALIGRNLADNQHPEFGVLEIPRSVFGKITWNY